MTKNRYLSPLLSLVISGCVASAGTGTPADQSERRSAEEGASPDSIRGPLLSPLLVIDDQEAGFQLGDTVSVAFDRVSDYGLSVALYENGEFARWFPLNSLGPRERGRMAVTASRLNVRDCPRVDCDQIRQLSEGDVVEVNQFMDGWYSLTEPVQADTGYAHAAFLILPVAYQRTLVRTVQVKTDEFYRILSNLNMPGYGSVFVDHDVRLDNGVLRFAFYSPHVEGSPLVAVCEGMKLIADYVERVMVDIPSDWINAYSAGVYYGRPWSPGRTEMELAGLADNGAVYCRQPY